MAAKTSIFHKCCPGCCEIHAHQGISGFQIIPRLEARWSRCPTGTQSHRWGQQQAFSQCECQQYIASFQPSHTPWFIFKPQPSADSVWSTPLNWSCTQNQAQGEAEHLCSHFSAFKSLVSLRNRAFPFSHSLSTHTQKLWRTVRWCF